MSGNWLERALEEGRQKMTNERPSITEATRRIDAEDERTAIRDEILAVTEDFAHYVARRGHNITVATPARRRLQMDLEKVITAFMNSEVGPTALDVRVDARLAEIERQQRELLTRIGVPVKLTPTEDNHHVQYGSEENKHVVTGDSPD